MRHVGGRLEPTPRLVEDSPQQLVLQHDPTRSSLAAVVLLGVSAWLLRFLDPAADELRFYAAVGLLLTVPLAALSIFWSLWRCRFVLRRDGGRYELRRGIVGRLQSHRGPVADLLRVESVRRETHTDPEDLTSTSHEIRLVFSNGLPPLTLGHTMTVMQAAEELERWEHLFGLS